MWLCVWSKSQSVAFLAVVSSLPLWQKQGAPWSSQTASLCLCTHSLLYSLWTSPFQLLCVSLHFVQQRYTSPGFDGSRGAWRSAHIKRCEALRMTSSPRVCGAVGSALDWRSKGPVFDPRRAQDLKILQAESERDIFLFSWFFLSRGFLGLCFFAWIQWMILSVCYKQSIRQPIAFGVSSNVNLQSQSQSHWSHSVQWNVPLRGKRDPENEINDWDLRLPLNMRHSKCNRLYCLISRNLYSW